MRSRSLRRDDEILQVLRIGEIHQRSDTAINTTVASFLDLVVTPHLVPFGGSCHHTLGRLHAVVQGLDFRLTLRLVALFPFQTMLHLLVERPALFIRQDTGTVKLNVLDVVGLAPLFAALFHREGD